MVFNTCAILRAVICFSIVLQFASNILAIGDIIYAVNAGGDSHTDIHGIRYEADKNSHGIQSDYGKNLQIQRVVPQDQILYQTERYNTETFGYSFPAKRDGDYVLVLKFCEVWFTAPNQKVFDILINGQHSIIEGLDIFGKVGRGAAHDEVIPFTIKGGKIKLAGEVSDIKNGKVSIDFVKGEQDNPKINAIYVMKGSVDDVPKLPPLPFAEKPKDDEEEQEEVEPPQEKEPKVQRPRKTSGPKVQDPYATDDTSSMMLPVFIAVGAFIPLVFFLCKL